MMKKYKVFLILVFGLAFLMGTNTLVVASIDPQQSVEIEGKLSVIWGDPVPGSTQKPTARYYLTNDNGNSIELKFGDDADKRGNLLGLRNQRVRVNGQQLLVADRVKIIVEQINPISGLVQNAPQVTGSQPWISIMCKFLDIPAEPQDLAFFQGMYTSTYPGLDHYWQEQSYGQINLAGSGAAGWFTLPHPESYYNPSHTQGGADLNKLFDDCTGVADASVDFSSFVGINMMFNSDFDEGYAWGGNRYVTLDGVFKSWRVTWEPPWGYNNIAVIAHETGHGFGLPHSTYNPAAVYDNYWDVMSSAWGSQLSDQIYGVVGQHTISYHKDRELNWIPASQKYSAVQNSRATITIERLALPQTTNYKMAEIPIGGSNSHFYTVEARHLVGYDAGLPGNAVIIHEVNTYWEQPAHVIDIDGNGDTDDAGTMWTVGETFTDAGNGISVVIEAATPTGYVVTIQLGNPTSSPGDFEKTAPVNGAINQPTDLTLTWESSPDASSYEYCYDTTNDNICSNWLSTGSDTFASLNSLVEDTPYYWQVRAENSGGSTYANGSDDAFWSFTTLLNPPQAFDKLTPIDSTTRQLTMLTLNWQTSSNATGFEYCYDISNDNACSNWLSNGASTFVQLTGLQEEFSYYWQVRAVNAAGVTYAGDSPTDYWAFTTTKTYLIFLPLLLR